MSPTLYILKSWHQNKIDKKNIFIYNIIIIFEIIAKKTLFFVQYSINKNKYILTKEKKLENPGAYFFPFFSPLSYTVASLLD
jgi:hypothetical protein